MSLVSLLLLSVVVSLTTAQQTITADGISFTTNKFPARIRQFEWIDNSATAILLSNGVLWGTRDGGISWNTFNPPTQGGRLIILPKDLGYQANTVLVRSANITYIADITTFQIIGPARDAFGANVDFDTVVFHPTDPTLALGFMTPSAEVCDPVTGMCNKVVLYSKDTYRTWEPVMLSASLRNSANVKSSADYQSTVYSAIWHNHNSLNFNPREIVFITGVPPSTSSSTLVANTYTLNVWNVDTASSKVLNLHVIRSRGGPGPGGNRKGNYNAFYLMHVKHFTFIATLNTLSQTHLLETKDNFVTTRLMNFPSAASQSTGNNFMDQFLSNELSYTILDTTEGSVFVNVKHSGKVVVEGDTYISDNSGSRFTASLEDTRREPDSGEVDFHKLRGLDGIYIANKISNPKDTLCTACKAVSDCNDQCGIASVITHDKGATWEQIQPPEDEIATVCRQTGGISGATLNADELQNCALHLHGYASGLDDVESIVSSPAAVGVLVGSGNVGPRLHTKTADGVNVYLSRDAGASWTRIAENPHTYCILDSGAFILLTRFDVDTNILRYSPNSGSSWKNVSFTSDIMNVEEILRPKGSESGRRAIIRGDDQSGYGVLVVVDASATVRPACDLQADVETFVPKSYLSSCLLGRSVAYTRRLPGHVCSFSPSAPQPPPVVKNCDCTTDDYECDYGYEQQWSPEETSTSCVKMPQFGRPRNTPAPTTPPCINGSYSTTRGYQKINGDSCVNGVDLNPILTPCGVVTLPGSSGSSGGHGGLIAFLLITIALVGVGCGYAYKYPDDARAKATAAKDAVATGIEKVIGFASSAAQYRPMGQGEVAGLDDDDDDAFRIPADDAPTVVVNSMLANGGSSTTTQRTQPSRGGEEKDSFLSFE
jgi:hypothetical protein